MTGTYADFDVTESGRRSTSRHSQTQNRGSRYEVTLPKLKFLREEITANVQGVASLPVSRLQYKIGNVSPDVLDQIREALRFALNMEEQQGSLLL